MRIAAIVEYDGTRYAGWQLQANASTIQAQVESALSRVADAPVRVVVAGRTDAGVHATAQVFHFDTDAERSAHGWLHGTNTHLPRDIGVLWVSEVSEEFHARFSARGRHYDYYVLNRPVRPGLQTARVTHEYRPLDVERMREAAGYLEGRHDFSAFRAAECQAKTAVRELRALTVERRGDLVRIHAYADAFLHHMVRNIAGVLLAVGAGEREPEWARAVLESRDRAQGGITAAPDGLYLTGIEYPPEAEIPQLSRALCLW